MTLRSSGTTTSVHGSHETGSFVRGMTTATVCFYIGDRIDSNYPSPVYIPMPTLHFDQGDTWLATYPEKQVLL